MSAVVPEVSERKQAFAKRLAIAIVAIALVGLPLLFSQLTIYRLGVVLIFVVAAIGLHILVNWAGELSLCHAGMVGVPAFVVAGLSERFDVSPLLLVPAGLVVGAGVGAIVALPALRAKGLQVALVTFAVGIAINSYFFNQSWLVGPASGRQAAVPSLGRLTFNTSKSLYPVVGGLFVLIVLATWGLYRSRVARAMLWVKADPEAAAVFGIQVRFYRILAYVLAGAFAGLSGSLTVVWTRVVSAQSFPTTLSFTYLLVVVIAGTGFVGGVIVIGGLLEGGALFISSAATWINYMGPIGLVLSLTANKNGINGAMRQVLSRFEPSEPVALDCVLDEMSPDAESDLDSDLRRRRRNSRWSTLAGRRG